MINLGLLKGREDPDYEEEYAKEIFHTSFETKEVTLFGLVSILNRGAFILWFI